MTTVSITSVVGRTIAVSISEPLEVAGVADTAPQVAEVLRVGVETGGGNDASILLRLKHPFSHEGIERQYFVVVTRYEGDDLLDLLRGEAIVCNLASAPAAQVQSADGLDLTAWRGGLVLTATLGAVK